VTEIKPNFTNGSYPVTYTNSAPENAYARSIEGIAYVNAVSGKQSKPNNAIVELLETWPLKHDPQNRVDIPGRKRHRLAFAVD
jgi:hypothetical protein